MTDEEKKFVEGMKNAQIVRREPCEDAISKEKIDKAIEEINDMPTIGYYEEPLGSRPMVFKDDILTIIKRNIGE